MSDPEREAAEKRIEAAMQAYWNSEAHPGSAMAGFVRHCARIAAEEIERVHEWLAAKNPPPGSDSQAKTEWWVEWSAVCPEEKPKKGWGPASLGWPTKDHPDPLEEEK